MVHATPSVEGCAVALFQRLSCRGEHRIDPEGCSGWEAPLVRSGIQFRIEGHDQDFRTRTQLVGGVC